MATPKAKGEVVRDTATLLRAQADRDVLSGLRKLCERARAASAGRIWIACRGDTAETESKHVPGYTAWQTPQFIGELQAECVIALSPPAPQNAGYSQIKRHAIVGPFNSQQALMPGRVGNPDRYEVLASRLERVSLYAGALRQGLDALGRSPRITGRITVMTALEDEMKRIDACAKAARRAPGVAELENEVKALGGERRPDSEGDCAE
jgi:hypothetical protein